MHIPLLYFSDISLLLAIGGVTLLVTLEIISPSYGLTNLILNKKKLRIAAITIGVLFLITFAITSYYLYAGSA